MGFKVIKNSIKIQEFQRILSSLFKKYTPSSILAKNPESARRGEKRQLTVKEANIRLTNGIQNK